MRVNVQRYIRRIYTNNLFMSAQVLVSAHNQPKIILQGNCHSTAPIKALKNSQGAILKIMDTIISFHKMPNLIKCIIVALNEV